MRHRFGETREGTSTQEAGLVLYHGSPFRFDDLRFPIYLTTQRRVAKQYATQSVLRRRVAAPGSATIYTIAVNPLRILDMRLPAHRRLYEKARHQWNEVRPDRWLPSSEGRDAEGFIMSHTLLPGYGREIAILEALSQDGHNFDAIWLDEGTQGASLAVFRGDLRVLNAEPLDMSQA